MEANEIRTGNLLMWGNDVVEIDSIDRTKNHEDLEGEVSFKLHKGFIITSETKWLHHMNKIPITDCWLKKAGCEKVNNSTWRMGTFTFQPINFPESNDGDIIDRMLNSKKGFRVCMQGRFVRNIFWIHDWQNFHFGISKEELIFKPWVN